MASNSLTTWLERIYSFKPGIYPGLEAISRAAKRCNLDKKLAKHVVLVAGTNGKGSTCELIHRCCMAAGLSVGLYTSPHISRFSERIRVNGVEISEKDLITQFERVESLLANDVKLSFFEYTTLAAFLYFKKKNLDVLILEVGLGGRLDAVNWAEPDQSIVTSISFDHQEFLGHTLDAIATEKLGIARAQKPLLWAAKYRPKALQSWCDALQTKLVTVQSSEESEYFFKDIHLKTAEIAYKNIQAQFKNARDIEIKQWMKEPLRGRCQIVSQDPYVVVDVAHNEEATERLAQFLKSLPKKSWRAVWSMCRDKEVKMIEPLKSLVCKWHIAPMAHERSASLGQLTAAVLHDAYVAHANLPNAISAAIDELTLDEGLIVFGSFHVLDEYFQWQSVFAKGPENASTIFQHA